MTRWGKLRETIRPNFPGCQIDKAFTEPCDRTKFAPYELLQSTIVLQLHSDSLASDMRQRGVSLTTLPSATA